MSDYQVTFLGTGTSQGIPVITCDCKTCSSRDPRDNRLRTSVMLSINNKNIVIDTGPDFRQQMLNNKVQMVDAILFTHEHKDHISGMDDIRPYNFRSEKGMEVYATTRVQEALKREYHYVFMENSYPGIPVVNLHTLHKDEELELFGEKIIPIEVMHYQLPVLAFRMRDFTYITDANFVSDEEFEKIKGTKTLVINALRKEKHISHFNLDEALDFIGRVNPERAYLTHISHFMGTHEDVSHELPKGVEIAYDGLKISVL